MATVTGKLIGGTPSRTEVTCSLVDVTGARAVGYVADETAEIVRPVLVKPQSDGTWSAELTPNALIDAAAGDTVWAVMEGRALDGIPVMTYIVVPEAGGPHWVGELRVDLGDAPTGGSTIVYVPGPRGDDGTDGVDGASAYEVWLEAGHTGTEADYLASLVGPSGAAEAQEYTDTAVTAEAVRADAAYEPAGAAATAQVAAVTAAAADATAKADAARTAAVSTAAADATSKANAAQSAATSTAAADATTKAANAQAAAVSTAALSAAALYLPKALLTVDAFMAQPGTKVFGHRGAGMVCPEHTEDAYDYAVSHGIQAMELSVNVDSEGQLWCCHDLTLDRTTYSTGALNSYPTTGIANRVLTNGRVLLGQGWTDQPMVPLRKMLDKYLGKGVILFLEPKGNDAVVPLQNLLATSYPHANQSVIWKAHVGTSFVWPKDNGFRTWCYVDDASSDAVLNGKDSLVDYWGVQTTMPSARRKEIVQRPGGKPVFSWPVYRRSQRAALEADGVVGLMSSDPVYVRGTTAVATASRWDLQVKESGGVPMNDYNTDASLKFSDTDGWVSINRSKGTYGLGRYCPVVPGTGGYRIQIEMSYPTLGSDLTLHGGLYFGKASDDVYEFSTLNASPGYHLVLRQNGIMRLYRHLPTQTGGVAIGAGDIATTAPAAGQSVTIQIEVTPTTVEARRLGDAGWTTGPIADATYRGGYFGLSNGSITDVAVRPFWRNLLVTQL
ncbi:glycerophosphodiester phosphodiesterase [Streptomyces sp. NBC_01422]|uniref:glycerophosphodiester phosphodiesterase n=1 Tax=Streptomyces sp. NBC_01422 TaxID=2903859 RepID=UPI002E2E6C35|nr:glycerophosphodiester phosphodiesterase [Streptomyces sp. NBC_01422]